MQSAFTPTAQERGSNNRSKKQRIKQEAERSLVVNNVPKFVERYGLIRRIVLPYNSATIFNKQKVRQKLAQAFRCTDPKIELCAVRESSCFDSTHKVFSKMLTRVFDSYTSLEAERMKEKESTMEGPLLSFVRHIEVKVMPSTSPASARMRPCEKEKVWHREAFDLEAPRKDYYCPGCDQSAGSHWFYDCPKLQHWKGEKRKAKRKTTSAIDHYRWYL